MRKVILFNENYIFEKDGCLEKVTLPHTWNALDGQGNSGGYYRGSCIYAKKFARPEISDGDQVYLEFRGANSSAEVFINGKKVARHDGGYSTFRANITEELLDENEIKILVDNSPNDCVYPQKADFTFYGGIYRDVYMIIVPETHFDMDYFGGNGFKITPHINGVDAKVMFEAYYAGDAEKIIVSVDGAGEIELASIRKRQS